MNARVETESRAGTANNKCLQNSAWRMRNAVQQQRTQLKRRLFGEHYNYGKVGLNKEKKYLLQEQKNTEIERHNLILLQKIQKISKRPLIADHSFRLPKPADASFQDEHSTARTNHLHTNRMRYDNRTLDCETEDTKFSFSAQKSSRVSKKYVFRGMLEAAGRAFEVRTYFEEDKYVIWVSLADCVQRIKLRREDYFEIYHALLEKKHSNIATLLRFNGRLFQLEEAKQAEVEVERETKLPAIERKQQVKHRTEPSLQS